MSGTIHLESQCYIPNTMQVRICIGRTIIIGNDIDTFNINSTTKNVCSYKNPLFKGFEGCIAIDTTLRYQRTVHFYRWD